MTTKAYRFQLRLKPSQAAKLRRLAGMNRWIWNRAINEQQALRARGGPYAGFAEMARWVTEWRKNPETAWLREGIADDQACVVRRLDEAYRKFFAKAGGYPSFKARGDDPCVTTPHSQDVQLDSENGRCRIPKVGWLRMRQSRPISGEVRQARTKQVGGKWYVSIVCEAADVVPAAGITPTLGIDLGLKAFAATSEGEVVPPLRTMESQARKLRHLQRSVSRKKKGSRNRRKAIDRLGRLHRRIAQQRNDWLHKLTTSLADQHAVIAVEDLNVSGMSAGAAGKGRAAKAGLNRRILDAGWAEFRRQLTYKTEARGGSVVSVPAAYTSRTCRLCGHESAENRKTQAVFSCVSCGHTEHADIHAAKNILAAGHAAWLTKLSAAACGGEVRRRRRASAAGATPMKQEPTEAKEPT